MVTEKNPKRTRTAKPAAPDTPAAAGNGAHEHADGPREHFGRTIAPNQIDNPEKRRQWGLPPIESPSARGFYIVELNVQYSGGPVRSRA